MSFQTDIMPYGNNSYVYSLGSPDSKWNLNGIQAKDIVKVTTSLVSSDGETKTISSNLITAKHVVLDSVFIAPVGYINVTKTNNETTHVVSKSTTIGGNRTVSITLPEFTLAPDEELIKFYVDATVTTNLMFAFSNDSSSYGSWNHYYNASWAYRIINWTGIKYTQPIVKVKNTGSASRSTTIKVGFYVKSSKNAKIEVPCNDITWQTFAGGMEIDANMINTSTLESNQSTNAASISLLLGVIDS